MQADGIKPFAVRDILNPDTGLMEPNLFFNGLNVTQFDKMDSKDFDDMFRNMNFSGMSDANAEVELLTAFGYTADLVGAAEFEADFGFSTADAVKMNKLFNDVLSLDVAPGVNMPITMGGLDVVFYTAVDENPPHGPIIRNTFNVLTDIYNAINGTEIDDPASTDILTKMIKTAQDAQNHILTRTAEIGGRQRRLELLEARFSQDNLNYEKMRSDAEDADMAEVIMFLKMAETVYQAALSAGARVIQPTLMDFLR